MDKKKSKLSRPLMWVIIALAAAAVVLLVIGGITIYRAVTDPMSAFEEMTLPTAAPVESAQPAETSGPTPEPTLSPEEIAAMEVEQLRADSDTSFTKNRVNILMLGWDESPERNDSSSVLYRDEANNFRSDVIMLLTINFDTGSADLISVPRDSLYPIYMSDGTLWRENSHYKINAAFAKGGSAAGDGFGYAEATISKLLGVPISNYVGVNMEGLKAVVDAMGGVDYDVDVEIKLNGRVLETGYQHLDGQQVLDYCRARKGISTDVGRNDRQQRMLFAILSQLKSRNQLAKFPKIYLSVKDYIYTDLTFGQISALCSYALDLDMSKLARHTLGGEYVNNTAYSGASYYVLHSDEVKALTSEVFGFEVDFPVRYDAPYVLADKAGSLALDYVSAAEYVYTLIGVDFATRDDPNFYRADLMSVNSAITEVLSVAQRTIPTGASEAEQNAILDAPLDKSACELAAENLRLALLALMQQRGLNQGSIDKKSVPTDLYNALAPAAIPVA